MARLLHVWDNGSHVATFRMASDGEVTLSYDRDNTNAISLSLPLDGGWAERAPINFLDALLPDCGNERLRMQDARGAASTHPFDLLESVDVIGGLVFTATDELPDRGEEPLEPVSEEDLRAKIERCRISSDAWWVHDDRSRFSLAGTQSKFTLALIDGEWFWPSVSNPSTHIIKPEPRQAPGGAAVESLTMSLAARCGIASAGHWVLKLDDTPDSYVTERFDREAGPDGRVRRLRTEDLTQALGITRDEKYDILPERIIECLVKADPTKELAYAWMRQLAFNVYVGNSDAHAKNYSVFLNGIPELTPLYDSICTRCWRGFDQSLAMPVNDVWFAEELTMRDWDELARSCRLDRDRVVHIAKEVSGSVRREAETLLSDGDCALSRLMLQEVRGIFEGMLSRQATNDSLAGQEADAHSAPGVTCHGDGAPGAREGR